MYGLLRPVLFALDPTASHALAAAALGPVEHLGPVRDFVRARYARFDPILRTRVMGLDFPAPLGLAGGFDKNATRARALACLGFGHLELGTVTALAQEPNPAPNLFRLPEDRALVNRLGFPNEGAARVVERIREHGPLGVPMGVSIGKSRVVPLAPIEGVVDDYLASFREARSVADFVVINVSSPNTKDLRAIQGAELARVLLGAVAKANLDGERVPLLVKIAPDLTDEDLDALLAVVAETKLDGVVATNTTLSREGLKTHRDNVAQIGAGGLSGAPLKERSRAMVGKVRKRLGRGFVVIGVGGIENADDVLAMMRAGADLVQAYTGFVYGGPTWPARVHRDLAAMVKREGAASLVDLAAPA